MSIEYVFTQMMILFSVLIIGYISNKAGFIDSVSNKKLSSIVLNLALPLKMLSSLNEANCTSEDILVMLGVGVCVFAFLILFSKLVPIILHIKGKEKPIVEFMTIFSNNGFMGYPVIETILGASALIYASIYDMLYSVVVFSYGVFLFQKSKSESGKIEWKKMISTASVAGFATMILAILGVRLPEVPYEVFLMIGNTATPLSMLVIGSTLAAIPLKEVFKGSKVYFFTVVRLVAVPLLVYGVFHPFISNELIFGTIVLVNAMPCAATTVMFAEQYESNSEMAAQHVFITTLLSVLTIPVIGYLLFI